MSEQVEVGHCHRCDHAHVSLGVGSYAAASPTLEPRQLCGEGIRHICHGAPDGTPQNVNPDDIAYLAASMRNDAHQNVNGNSFFTMPPNIKFQCEEWAIAHEGTVLVLVKHTSARLNSTVLSEDIANTLDRGENATDEQVKKSILGCGKSGGQVGVLYDKDNKAYNTDEFKNSKATPSGLVIKVVHSV
ncbi:hypothetical protein B0T18DRAFT_455888 [Schizothecium vesticola]|uniref:Uncharacterized protein n=1 Tax=Schizothecium vesticola TaxID=314040 RepID=A0AA40K9I1_9PEZI|nr:hypothetical protein B0T18DRAFT_455888 [Schizothecium vesticola]